MLLDIINYVNTTCVSIEFTKPVEAIKSDSPKAREEADVVTATVKPSKSKGTGNGTKDKKQMAVKSVPCSKLEGEDLVKQQHVKVSNCASVYVIGMSLSKPHHMRSTVKSVFLLAWYIIPYMAEKHLSGNQNYIKLEWCIKC